MKPTLILAISLFVHSAISATPVSVDFALFDMTKGNGKRGRYGNRAVCPLDMTPIDATVALQKTVVV